MKSAPLRETVRTIENRAIFIYRSMHCRILQQRHCLAENHIYNVRFYLHWHLKVVWMFSAEKPYSFMINEGKDESQLDATTNFCLLINPI